MRMNKAELLTALRLAAKYLPEATAGLMNEAATRLDVTSSALSEALAQRDVVTEEHAAAMNTITALMDILGTSDTLSISGQVAALKAERDALAEEQASPIPEGWKLVPEQMYLSADDIESISQQCGNGDKKYGDFNDGILWVGELSDDDGTVKYGLNIAAANYPEEGSIMVHEIDLPGKQGAAQIQGVE